MLIFPPRRYLCDQEDTWWCLVGSEAVLHAPAAMFLVAGLVCTSLALFLPENACNVVDLSCFRPTPILGNGSGERVQEKAEYHKRLKFLTD